MDFRCLLSTVQGTATREMNPTGEQVLAHLVLTEMCEAASPLAGFGHLAAFLSPHGAPALLRVGGVVLDTSIQQYFNLNQFPMC